MSPDACLQVIAGQPLGSYAITLASTARVHLFEARDFSFGPQAFTENEVDFKLSWWPMGEAIAAAEDNRFLLPAGPLALMLAERGHSELFGTTDR
ncbi:hypothetical protein [Streptomyces lavendofoliae]|uniref:hypothetical protein n=1 Tax=Streptomyces lavendofoliae TaxID=67314 RepID=UPI001E2BB1E6|nr:hypothetical protein [Streptomyces lavendofoliae]